MAELNRAHIEAVMRLANESPYFGLMGMRLDDMSEGRALVRVQVVPDHLNVFGGIHGGAYASLLDTAAYWALYCSLEESEGFTTIDLNVSDLRAVNEGSLVVEGRVIKRGRTVSLCEADVRDDSGRLLAHATSKMLIGPMLQPMRDAVSSLGLDPLPPKFLSDASAGASSF